MSLTDTARVLYDSPLSRPKNAIFAVIVLVVLLLTSTFSLFRVYFSTLSPTAVQVYIMGLLGTLLVTLCPLAILWFLDRREPESRWLYVIAFLWGALIASGIAFPVNNVFFKSLGDFVVLHPDIKGVLGEDAVMLLTAPIAGPLVEETAKGLGVLLLFWLFRSEFDNVRDGFIYGALVGIGFNLQETPFYITKGFISTGDIPLYYQIADRLAIFGFAGHPLFTGLFGMGLGLARQTTRRWLRYAAPVGGWLLGFSAHFLNNMIGLTIALVIYFQTGKPVADPPATVTPALVAPFLNQWVQESAIRLVSYFPFFLIVGVMLWQSGIWERHVIREQLADEQEPVITPSEYEAVKGDRIFRTRRIPGYDRRISTAIVRAQDELAFRKWRVQQQGQDVNTDALVGSWRAELGRLRETNQPIGARVGTA
ncbi:PrsW family intramembrane metalloprotease [Pantanalinema sp. GBBB05]|uniref:PrsW family intramembrane metalloprotease n=1 Tax=Pantanalinema sp. GBBB05 TaxID=2604139 RepID=UPI001E054254|nr:PrsW family intramembrane metalloprotease [Pantanalinema sp. GBBB05]